ncbi:MAG: tetratricopeptide repeat protein [Bacteroidales bacterium]|nr:tetratricopeptide repeat protein [Bacteroidales bacterium]
MKLRIPYKLIFAFFLLGSIIIVYSCSTKKNTFTRRVYHNLTTHYNIYWNANESYKNGILDLQKNLRDNYNKILFVNNYGSADDSRKIYSAMDRSIEKASLAIQRHSLFFNKKEYNRWVDDCYLLIGKAQFYKQDYLSAKRTFEYLTRQYPDEAIAHHANLWMIKTSLQQKKYDEVLAGLELMDATIEKDRVPFSVRKQIPLIYADYYILNGNYTAAKNHLLEGITLNADRKFRMRLYYILGQISQQEKDYAKATEYYTKVSKGPSSFEMAFNARINMAKAFDIYTGDKSNLEKQLKRMAKDTKNKEFLDQVYFALAELAQLDKNDTLVMHYLRLSVSNSVSNDYQKTTSSLQLAEMCFTKQKYEDARAYYDTTLQVLPIDYPNYETISTRTATLTELVTNLQVVQYEDSMQMLARMPEAELTALITKLVDEYNKKEQARLEEERQQQMDIAMAMGNQNQQRNERGTQDLGGGGWYFNNPSAISMGYTEFMRKWGRRKLEDNWRLMNKRAVTTFSSEEGDAGETGTPGDSVAAGGGKAGGLETIDPKDPKSYMKLIPKSPEALEASNTQISEALLNLGYIYKDGLHDIPHSLEAFEELLERYPDTKYALNIYYQLYLMGIDIPDEALAAKYKEKIMTGYPASDYALIIENPDYNNEVLAKKNRINTLYEETYQAFTRGQYRMVLLYSNEATTNYKDKDLIPKFEYLKALALAKVENTDTMLVVLNKVVKTYPSSSVTPLAQEILNKYGKGTPVATTTTTGDTLSTSVTAVVGSSSDTVVPAIYKVNPNQTHFYIMMLNERNVNVSATKIRISDFISKSFNNDNLSVNAILLDAGWQMITISSFRNAQAAINFFKTIQQSEYVMLPLKDSDYKHFVISMENYPIFYREKKYDGYINFFNKNYPR